MSNHEIDYSSVEQTEDTLTIYSTGDVQGEIISDTYVSVEEMR